MPYLDPAHQRLPFQHDPTRMAPTSREGAQAIAPHAKALALRYQTVLARHPEGVTDAEAAEELRVERTTVIPRRHELGPLVACVGTKRAPSGVRNKLYGLVRKEA